MTETKRTKAQLLKENDRPRAEVGTLHPAETEQASPRDIIREALDRADTEILRREAHAINGGAANLAAAELSSAAAELEKTAKSGSLGEAPGVLERLERAYSAWTSSFTNPETVHRDRGVQNENHGCGR